MPIAEPLGQTAPFAPVFGNIQAGLQNLQIVERHIAALCREAWCDVTILSLGEFPVRSSA